MGRVRSQSRPVWGSGRLEGLRPRMAGPTAVPMETAAAGRSHVDVCTRAALRSGLRSHCPAPGPREGLVSCVRWAWGPGWEQPEHRLDAKKGGESTRLQRHEGGVLGRGQPSGPPGTGRRPPHARRPRSAGLSLPRPLPGPAYSRSCRQTKGPAISIGLHSCWACRLKVTPDDPEFNSLICAQQTYGPLSTNAVCKDAHGRTLGTAPRELSRCPSAVCVQRAASTPEAASVRPIHKRKEPGERTCGEEGEEAATGWGGD